ncbi:MAG: hypothetical protein MJZ77_00905 [Bacteroidales bacterium]|nr:hypothetical protein [Bacteroidales bacterium]
MKRYVLLILMLLGCCSAWSQTVGEWRDHNSFVAARQIQSTPTRVYAATRSAMFYYDKEEFSTKAMTKVSGLSDMGISTFAYDERLQCLAIAYSNSGFDMVMSGNTYHIADIRTGNISGDKKVYHVRFHGDKAYLATGFGIVVVNVARHEIEETYYLGENGENAAVYDVAFTDSLIVAATDHGLLDAPKGSRRLHIFDEWKRDTLSPLHGLSVRTIEVCQGHLVAAVCSGNLDSMMVFYQDGNQVWYSLPQDRLASLRCHNNRIVVNRADRIEIYDADFHLVETINALPNFGMSVGDADCDEDGTIWIGHSWAGLVRFMGDRATAYSYAPAGPLNDDYVYSLVATYDKVFVCPGGKKPTYENMYIGGSLSMFDGKEWSQIKSGENAIEFRDLLYMAVDPKKRRHISATAWGYGVLDVQDNIIQDLYTQHNTDGALQAYASGDFVHLRVSGLAYDDKGSLWVTNSLVNNGLAVRYKDGSWESFDISPMLQDLSKEKREIDKLIWDSINDYKWIAGRANRIYIHDGRGQMAYVNPNRGSKLETHTVTAIVQDRNGDIWFGTDKGLKVIYDSYRAFSNGGRGEMSPVTCSNILYNEDGINEYLMAYESITCIAVDGANRKWVGTANNGLYLISANGLEQIHHFTTANSPLASDKIVALAVHPDNGILYIGTDKGLQSYRSTATEADEFPLEDIHAFPNPVRPEYDGVISIKGFARDALVHITDARGHTVFSTKAQGGQATWNGCNQSGGKVGSGTYFVFASDSLGKMRSVTKILIVR